MSNTSNITEKHLVRGNLMNENLSSYNVDIRNRKEILDIFAFEKPNVCIHLAAKIRAADSMKNPEDTMDVNVNGTINILDACHNNQVNDLVFASSAAVYGNVKELPIRETFALEPISSYGISKMLAEEQVLSYQKGKKINNPVILRIFNVYGDGQSPETDVITQFMRRLSKGLPPIIYGNGTRTRDFISVDEVVDGILLSIHSTERKDKNRIFSSSPIFNLGTGIPTSIKKVAEKMIEIYGLDIQPIYKEEPKHMRYIMHSYADMTRAKRVLGFMPKKSIETGLTDLIGSAQISES